MNKLETKFGTIDYTLYDNESVGLRTEYISNGNREVLTVFGIPYTITLHLYKQPDGSWTNKKAGDAYAGDLYINRYDNWSKSASDAAKKAIKAELIRVWTAFIAGKDDLLTEAQRAKLTAEHKSKESERDELYKQAEKLTSEMEEILKQIWELPPSRQVKNLENLAIGRENQA